MLEKPDLPEEAIFACLQDIYGLPAVQVDFLPLGADPHTAVYRAAADDGTAYFLKLRGGLFDETSVTLPKFLGGQGIAQIIAPLAARTGQLWASLGAFKLIVYPFVEGRNGYEASLSDRQWVAFGAAVKRIHTASVPPALIGRIQRETYSSQWRETVRTFLERVDRDEYEEPTAVQLAAFIRSRRKEILELVDRADRHAQELQARSPQSVLCHSDLHAGNLLIGAGGVFFIVDWDNPILAPKERDLMFIGGGQGFSGHSAQEEELLFYQGYGQTPVDSGALAYYRCERIIQDIAVFCEQLLLTDEGGEDREQSLRYFMSNFLPGGTIDMAYKADQTRSLEKRIL